MNNKKSTCFVFCEAQSGVIRFRVESEEDGKIPAEQAASLLAMQCIVRGQEPSDYKILIENSVGEKIMSGIAERSKFILDSGRAISPDRRLSPREKNVLDEIIKNKANKEIASQLNISERTVKFHVSSLLAKYDVRDRVSLMREAMSGLAASGRSFLFGETAPIEKPRETL